MKNGSNIVIINEINRNQRNMISEYERHTIDNIKAHFQAFIRHHSRQAKNSVQIYHSVSN